MAYLWPVISATTTRWARLTSSVKSLESYHLWMPNVNHGQQQRSIRQKGASTTRKTLISWPSSQNGLKRFIQINQSVRCGCFPTFSFAYVIHPDHLAKGEFERNSLIFRILRWAFFPHGIIKSDWTSVNSFQFLKTLCGIRRGQKQSLISSTSLWMVSWAQKSNVH